MTKRVFLEDMLGETVINIRKSNREDRKKYIRDNFFKIKKEINQQKLYTKYDNRLTANKLHTEIISEYNGERFIYTKNLNTILIFKAIEKRRYIKPLIKKLNNIKNTLGHDFIIHEEGMYYEDFWHEDFWLNIAYCVKCNTEIRARSKTWVLPEISCDEAIMHMVLE